MATVSKYNVLGLNFLTGLVKSSDTLKVMLLANTYTFSAAHDEKADVVSHELANGNGYTTGGAKLAGVTTGQVSGVATLDANDTVWTASGGAIGPVRYAVVYDDTASGDPILFMIDFGADKTADDGAEFKIRWHTDGILTIT